MHKFLFPIVLPSASNDPSGTFDDGSVYYNTIGAIKIYNNNSWQFLPNFSSLSGLPTPQLVGGFFVCPYAVNANATTTLTMTNGRIYWIPFQVNRRTLVNYIGLRVTTAAANSSQTVGIYSTNMSNLYPNLRLVSVTISTTATGTFGTSISPATTLDSGIYWLAVLSTGAPTLSAISLTSLRALAFTNTLGTITHFFTSGTSLPNPAPTTGYSSGTTAFPAIVFGISY